MKRLFILILAAVLMAALTAGACSTAVTDAEEASGSLQSWLRDLQPEDYRDLTVTEFRSRLLPQMDNPEARNWQQLMNNDAAYEMRRSSDLAAYYYDVVEPLTAERWQLREFGGAASTGNAAEYVLRLTVADPERLTVGLYEKAPQAVQAALQDLLEKADPQHLHDEQSVQLEMQTLLDDLFRDWQPLGLEAAAELIYRFDAPADESDAAAMEVDHMSPATDADYQALLALMTPGWEEQPLAQFNAQLLDWANAHTDVRRRLHADLAHDVQPARLTDAEAFFLQHTVFLSSMEIARHVDSINSATAAHPPAVDVRLPEKRMPRSSGPDVWADLWLSFSYCVDDPLCTTVARRDQAVAAVAGAVRRFWAEHTLDEVLQLGEAGMRRQLETLVRNSSPDGIRFTLAADDFSLETTTG